MSASEDEAAEGTEHAPPGTMARQWHYAIGQERQGPMPYPELRRLAESGGIQPQTLVWTDGMKEWVPAFRIQGLFPDFEQPVVEVPRRGDATGGLIPYKNVPALLAYYAAVFALLPVFPIGLAALALGIRGLQVRAKRPEAKGAAHAWLGIIVGGGLGLLWLGLTVYIMLG